ncbi:adenylate/guanylate cyclase domain-containing protein [Cohaesibacter sp. CAU 1516]|uniref:adenylate/guanylate cyclase domain-containing protein n=1 Tax=Cohaesibacter sp. CAU 1516 TaxID=2576038 RepID=UPI0014850712|nr:adenylate/guanylate cyclase domain-containing protein [Cohaesibacter sp. CAU 1516]
MEKSLASNRRRWPRLPISVMLGVSVGALLIITTMIIIFYMGSHARQLLGQQIALETKQRVTRLSDAVNGHLDDVERLAQMIHLGLSPLDEVKARETLIVSALSARAAPMRITLSDLSAMRTAKGAVELASAGDPSVEAVAKGWSKVPEDGALLYHLPAASNKANAVSITLFPAALSKTIADVSDLKRERSYLLADKTSLMAHSSWTTDAPPSSLPLANAGDRDLRNIWLHSKDYRDLPIENAHIDRGDRGKRVFTWTDIARPNITLMVGLHAEAKIFGAVFSENRTMVYASLGIVALSLAIGVFISIMIGRPIERLAITARKMENLSLEEMPELNESMMKELDEANSAILSAFRALGAFSKFVPRDVVRQVMDGTAIGADRTELRNMTIMFTDLAGFTTLATQKSPQETATLLNDHFEMVTTIVDQAGGTVDKFLGDGVMAFWGAPVQQPDHAERALAAARDILTAFEARADESMRLRIGICTGDVLVGISGSKVRMNYTVIGDTVNVAARLQELGKEVAADARTVALAGGSTVDAVAECTGWSVVGQKTLRGRQQPIDVYRFDN